MEEHSGKNVFKLGFGLMRLPRKENGAIDVELTAALGDKFIAGGGTYFDTAYVYDGGGSEAAFKAAAGEVEDVRCVAEGCEGLGIGSVLVHHTAHIAMAEDDRGFLSGISVRKAVAP